MTKGVKLIEHITLVTILEDIPVGILLLDQNGHIITANKAFLQILSYRLEQLTDKPIGEILSPGRDQSKHSLPPFAGMPASSKQIAEVKGDNGKLFRIEIRAYDPKNSQEKFYMGFIVGTQEVNDLRDELNRQIQMKDFIQDELEEESELSDLKSRFLSIASHEFRTPLAGIMSSINLISRYLEAEQENGTQFRNKEKVANHLSKINESVKNLTTILDRFLALGNIEQGEIPLRLDHFDIEGALNKQSVQFQELCKPGQKIIYRHIGQEKSVYLDKNLLKNIINNLLSNAIRFSQENSEIKLITHITSDEVRIELSDEGIGIPIAEQNNIFRRFYRAKNALAFQDGTGLGLSIVKKYVELMKGNISFKSEENMGTTFYITFPN